MNDLNRRICSLRQVPRVTLFAAIFGFVIGLAFVGVGWWLTWWFNSLGAGLGIPLPPAQRAETLAYFYCNKPGWSFLLGLILGLPHALWLRRKLSTQSEVEIEQMAVLRPTLQTRDRVKMFLSCIPVITTHIGACYVAYFLRIAVYPAMFSSGAAMIFCYSSYKKISEEAIKRLEARQAAASPFTNV